MVYDLLKEEMTPPEGSIHALQMTLKTEDEVKSALAKKKEEHVG
jgi:stress-induced morphogen